MENLSERKKKEWITEISFPIFPLFSFFPLLLIFSLFLFSVFLSRFRFSPQEIPLALRPHISQPYINIRRSFEPVSSRGRPFLCQRIVMGRSPEDIVHETWKNGRDRFLDAKHFYNRHFPSLVSLSNSLPSPLSNVRQQHGHHLQVFLTFLLCT